MLLPQAVLEAVLPVANLAGDAHGRERVDVGLALGMRALHPGRWGRFTAQRCAACSGCGGFPPRGGPFAGASALVGCFGSVVEAEGVFTGLAPEGQEVKLVAVGILAVGADGFEVFVHGGVGFGVGGGRGGG